jgi:hypothetical protein
MLVSIEKFFKFSSWTAKVYNSIENSIHMRMLRILRMLSKLWILRMLRILRYVCVGGTTLNTIDHVSTIKKRVDQSTLFTGRKDYW